MANTKTEWIWNVYYKMSQRRVTFVAKNFHFVEWENFSHHVIDSQVD